MRGLTIVFSTLLAIVAAAPRWGVGHRFFPAENGGSGGTFYPSNGGSGGTFYPSDGGSGGTFYPGNGGSGHSGGEITIRTTLRTQGCDEVHDIKRLTMSIYFKTLFVTLRRGKADMSLQ